MKDKSIFRLLYLYICRLRKTILLYSLFTLLYGIVFYLYNLTIEAVAYAALLCICVGLIFLSIDFIRFMNRHKQLILVKENSQINITGLPLPNDLIEEDYQDIIKMIHEDRIKITSAADISLSDMIEYYTLWVHQIKTPIAAMDLLLQSEENALNNELSIELFKIEQYVEFVLQYLRLESMNSDLLLKTLDLDSIIKQSIRKYAKLFVNKKLKLNYTDLDCQILTDEKWFLFVIEQLLSNALKYTMEGSISIYLDPILENTLVIEDTGIGIEEQDLPRVFERGYTGYNGRADKKSTGLGLYLCKQILNRLSHTITITSTVGKGTKVYINFSTVDILKKPDDISPCKKFIIYD